MTYTPHAELKPGLYYLRSEVEPFYTIAEVMKPTIGPRAGQLTVWLLDQEGALDTECFADDQFIGPVPPPPRPIADAPTDGTLIVGLYPDRAGHEAYSLRYWSTGSWGKRTEGWSDQYRQLRDTDPTHFLVLPDRNQLDTLEKETP